MGGGFGGGRGLAVALEIVRHHFADAVDGLFADTLDLGQLVGSHLRELLDGLDAVVFEFLKRLVAEPLELRHGRAAQRHGGHLRLNFLPLFFLALDVNSPAEQARRQAHVLPLLPDGERQLRVVHDDFQVFLLGVENRDVIDLRRAQRVRRKCGDIVAELDDVNLLAAQFPDDGLNAHAFHPHASAHAVHVRVLRKYGGLGPLAGLPRNGPDHHRAVVDFRHFHFEQFLHQQRIGAREDHLRPARRAVHGRDGGPNAVSDLVAFEPRLLLARHAGLGASEVQNHVGAFRPLNRAVYNLSDALAVFGVNRIALRLADFLENHLLRGLRRDAAQHVRGFGKADFAPHGGFRADLLRIRQRHFAVRVRQCIHHGLHRENLHEAGLLIEVRLEVL